MKNIPIPNQVTSTFIHELDKEMQEFETWIKNMNYKLFLEHTHSNEYYKQNQPFIEKEGESPL